MENYANDLPEVDSNKLKTLMDSMNTFDGYISGFYFSNSDKIRCFVCFVWKNKESSTNYVRSGLHSQFIQLVKAYLGNVIPVSKEVSFSSTPKTQQEAVAFFFGNKE